MVEASIFQRSLILFVFLSGGKKVVAEVASTGLADPAHQTLFSVDLPNPLDPSFLFQTSTTTTIEVTVGTGVSDTGLVDANGDKLPTPIWGYGTEATGHTWPGRTFEVTSDEPLRVKWINNIPISGGYILTGKDNGELGDFTGRSVVDTSYHWAYSIPGYEQYTIENHGTPIVPHLHGSHTDAPYDGNPEYFFTPEWAIKGPQWVDEEYVYANEQPAAMLWYHDHALGITRLNVHAGMAGVYMIRDEKDTGKPDNAYDLPAFPYEMPLLIQDRMFKENGELFYPSFKGDPFYADFITDEGAQVEDDHPSALAEFFGDFMVVNGKIWPKMKVEPRQYRLRLLNGCDSRFLVVQFMVDAPEFPSGSDGGFNVGRNMDGIPIPFTVIGGDQGLAASPTKVDRLLVEPSARYDIIIDFAGWEGRVIMKNLGGDEPFGGDIPGPQAFEFTDKIMAFDIDLPFDNNVPDNFDPNNIAVPIHPREANRMRRVALFEGHDQFGRLQPLLGTVDPATDASGEPIYWPNTAEYRNAGISGPMVGAMTWHAPTTENPRLYDVEDWEIWNVSADAHPVHLHLVHFEVIRRQLISYDSNVNEDGEIEIHLGESPAGDGTYTMDHPLLQHDGSIGEGYLVMNPTYGDEVDLSTMPEYVTNFPKDTVTALPGQVTTIRVYFDKPGRYNWHCHILSHEDHEMMRVFHVGPLPKEESEEGMGRIRRRQTRIVH
ncbi:Multicopper oxidase LPR1 homolog [Seminavis robusta]|uniref:Multicopper oxidase LPR1 homolog n=1 Tax=Seminavis robusta TaxID=568900 RepID=A0A9N8EN42_9STRA|nr:Multicopper oxidase LPR1 homolog [Seminavis robusta]|eukprot:Sro1501_g277940.1 Multicopper oxidase LPR1 homolog (716) ;mRNA; r:20960-23481